MKNARPAGCAKRPPTTHVPDPFNYGLKQVKAAHLPHEFAFPLRYVMAPEVIGTPEADQIKAACPYEAIDLEMESQEINLKVAAIIWATGWRPYDAEKIGYYGFGKHRNVITNVMLERFAASQRSDRWPHYAPFRWRRGEEDRLRPVRGIPR